MKKLSIGISLLTSWGNNSHQGTYVHQVNGEYATDYFTVTLSGNFIVKHTGYCSIRNGMVHPKEFAFDNG